MIFSRIIIILLMLVQTASALDLRQEISLQGEWLFEIGDNMDYRLPNYNDSKWERINVPDLWENEGFPGYDGFAWYRISIEIPQKLAREQLYLKLGRIDDVDETYLNGNKIGATGSFPPNYKTAWNDKRIYQLNKEYIHFGQKNVIAIRVLDYQGGGGISDGDVGVFSRSDTINLHINLNGEWWFKTGDDPAYSQPLFDDSDWETIKVPSFWEKQGFPEYNGIAWYRQHVNISDHLAKSILILLLGKINDIDEVYFNGSLIGHTGVFPKKKDDKGEYKNSYKMERAYFISPNLIRSGKNIIAVRVMDIGNRGGIYTGYIGITTREEYMNYSKRKK